MSIPCCSHDGACATAAIVQPLLFVRESEQPVDVEPKHSDIAGSWQTSKQVSSAGMPPPCAHLSGMPARNGGIPSGAVQQFPLPGAHRGCQGVLSHKPYTDTPLKELTKS
uniref:Uncharacterized protein n=1 Tax=Eutreptiella gymnastica TaxID=73025 RepID=A0A7S4G2M8_9EUGL